MAYVVNKLASQCPAPQRVTQTWFVGSNQSPGNAPTSSTLSQGDTAALLTKFNTNASRADFAAAYGAGGIGIVWGLALSPISGLSLRVGSGQANILGCVELTSNTTLILPDDTANIRVWLQQDGNLNYVVGSNVPPMNPSCFLGFVTTASGTIDTDIDVSGVVSLNAGGGISRDTADAGTPSDSPSSNIRIQTNTVAGAYHWDGTTHNQAVDSSQMAFTSDGVTITDGHLRAPYETQALSAMLQLTSSSANDVRVTCSTSQDVQLPPDADAELSMRFRVFNDNMYIAPIHKNVVVKDSTGMITLCTLAEKEFCEIIVQWDGSSATWPSTAVVQQQL